MPTAKLRDFFERLNSDCAFGYKYKIWSGEEFKAALYVADESIHRQFFPNYFAVLPDQKTKK